MQPWPPGSEPTAPPSSGVNPGGPYYQDRPAEGQYPGGAPLPPSEVSGYQQQPYQSYGPVPPAGYAYPTPYVVAQAPSNGLGTAGFVTGLLGLIFFWVPGVGLVLGILGIVLGAAGISAGRKSGAGTGLAIAGLVLGIVSLVPAIIVISAVSNA